MPVFPTVAEVLELDQVRQGHPEVVAGQDSLDRAVRWAHVSELADIAGLLRGGELILTTGVALPADDVDLAAYVADLDNVGAAGLVVELGRRYAGSLPPALVRAAQGRGLPLVALHRQTRFVSITEAVHARVVDTQVAELRASAQVHQTFTELSVEGAEPAEVLRQAAQMAGCPVVLENLAHQVLAYDAGGRDAADLLDGWEARSRSVELASRTGYDERTGWVLTVVGARGHDWGRLVLVADGPPEARELMLVERCASTLALNRLVERDRESLERQSHRTLLAGILDHTWPDAEVLVRGRALGVPLDGRRLVAVVVRREPVQGEPVLETERAVRELAEQVASAVRESRVVALVGALDDSSVGALLAARGRVDGPVESLAAVLQRTAPGTVTAVGSVVGEVRDVRRSFLEAAHVADAAASQPGRPFHRLEDVRLRGLLHLLRDDARVQTFVEREIGPLLAYDAQHGTSLVQLLEVYLDSGRNKSAAADSAHLSRPAFYERLHRIERVLGVDLDSVDSCLSLQVALVARAAMRR